MGLEENSMDMGSGRSSITVKSEEQKGGPKRLAVPSLKEQVAMLEKRGFVEALNMKTTVFEFQAAAVFEKSGPETLIVANPTRVIQLFKTGHLACEKDCDPGKIGPQLGHEIGACVYGITGIVIEDEGLAWDDVHQRGETWVEDPKNKGKKISLNSRNACTFADSVTILLYHQITDPELVFACAGSRNGGIRRVPVVTNNGGKTKLTGFIDSSVRNKKVMYPTQAQRVFPHQGVTVPLKKEFLVAV